MALREAECCVLAGKRLKPTRGDRFNETNRPTGAEQPCLSGPLRQRRHRLQRSDS